MGMYIVHMKLMCIYTHFKSRLSNVHLRVTHFLFTDGHVGG
jgi:prepilin-type processing-associated H-X9-DG protein